MSDSGRRWRDRILPDDVLIRRLSIQSMLFAVGEGSFATGSAVFFTQVVGLSAAQVGVGLTVAGVFSFVLSVPGGRVVDMVGARRSWALGALVTAVLYAVWPVIGDFAGYLLIAVALEVVDSVASSARGAYAIGALTREQRVGAQAYMRAALNIGFTAGAAIGGIALAFDNNTVVKFVPLVTAVLLLANAWSISRLPGLPDEAAPATAPEVAGTPSRRRSSALRNRGFVIVTAGSGLLNTNQVLLSVVIPLWLVQATDAPHVLLAWLFATNTVLTVLLQVAAAKGIDSVSTSLRAARISGAFFVASCLITLVTDSTVGWVTIVLVWLGHIMVTGAELYASGAHWGLMADLSDPNRRGDYQGTAGFGARLGSVWAPAAFTYLAIHARTPGWLIIAGVMIVGVAIMHPAARAAERYLARELAVEPA